MNGQAVNQVFGQASARSRNNNCGGQRSKQCFSRSRILTAVAGGSTRCTCSAWYILLIKMCESTVGLELAP